MNLEEYTNEDLIALIGKLGINVYERSSGFVYEVLSTGTDEGSVYPFDLRDSNDICRILDINEKTLQEELHQVVKEGEVSMDMDEDFKRVVIYDPETKTAREISEKECTAITDDLDIMAIGTNIQHSHKMKDEEGEYEVSNVVEWIGGGNDVKKPFLFLGKDEAGNVVYDLDSDVSLSDIEKACANASEYKDTIAFLSARENAFSFLRNDNKIGDRTQTVYDFADKADSGMFSSSWTDADGVNFSLIETAESKHSREETTIVASLPNGDFGSVTVSKDAVNFGVAVSINDELPFESREELLFKLREAGASTLEKQHPSDTYKEDVLFWVTPTLSKEVQQQYLNLGLGMFDEDETEFGNDKGEFFLADYYGDVRNYLNNRDKTEAVEQVMSDGEKNQFALGKLYAMQEEASKGNHLKGDSPSVLAMLSYDLTQNLFYQGAKIDKDDPSKITGLESDGITSIYDIPARDEVALIVKKDENGDFVLKTGDYNRDASEYILDQVQNYVNGDISEKSAIVIASGIDATEFDNYRSTKNICPEFLDMNDLNEAPLKLSKLETSDSLSVNVNGVTVAIDEGTSAYIDMKDPDVAYILSDKTLASKDNLDVNLIEKIAVDSDVLSYERFTIPESISKKTEFTIVGNSFSEDLTPRLDFSSPEPTKEQPKETEAKKASTPTPKPPR